MSESFNQDEIKISIDKVILKTDINRTIFLDVSLDVYELVIKNIQVVLKNPKEDDEVIFFDIEFPYTWNPIVSEEFYALSFSTKRKMEIMNTIRKWVSSQKFLKDFLVKGWDEIKSES